MTSSVAYSGIIPPLITPLTAEGQVDVAGLNSLIEFLILGGVSGLFVLGTSGEGPWLTTLQRAEVVRHAVLAAGNRVPVLAGVLDAGPTAVAENARIAAAYGADAVVVTTPYYFDADHTAQLRHFDQILKAVELPVMLYNIPGMTHNPLTPALAAHLAQHPEVIGIKDSAGDWDAFEQLLEIPRHTPDFVVFQGAEKLAARALLHGADGAVPGLANVAPALFAELFQAAKSGSSSLVNSLDAQIQQLWKLHEPGYWLTCLKCAASQLGFGSGATVSANPELSEHSRATIQELVSTAHAVTQRVGI